MRPAVLLCHAGCIHIHKIRFFCSHAFIQHQNKLSPLFCIVEDEFVFSQMLNYCIYRRQEREKRARQQNSGDQNSDNGQFAQKLSISKN
jgi:hypothetical protein